MSSEFERIAELERRLTQPSPDVLLGIGDDAAVVAPGDEAQALSVDTQVQDVHFRRAWASAFELGQRAMLTALSDLAAMAARPRYALLALTLPPSLEDRELFALADGVAAAAHENGCPVVGGNLSRGRDLSLTTTVCGTCPLGPLRRDRARPGDRLWLTGTVGTAALGLAALQQGSSERGALPFIERWRKPSARLTEALALAGTARAGIDLSDGLLQDLGHLCRASGVGARIRATALPLAPGHRELAQHLGVDPLAAALSGGEDYELLLALPAHADADAWASPIGECTNRLGELAVLGADGQPLAVTLRGWQHSR